VDKKLLTRALCFAFERVLAWYVRFDATVMFGVGSKGYLVLLTDEEDEEGKGGSCT
jgi:hypothetical protein